MYKLHLILKYLRKRRIAWVSLIAVTLCTAMVIVVISVMGGWLRMFEESFHGLSGDVLISSAHGLQGFAHYQEIQDEVEKLPEVAATAPVIQAYGLLDVGKMKRQGVQVIGYPMDKIGKINGFVHSLYWQYDHYIEAAKEPGLSSQERQNLLKQASESAAHASFNFSPLPPAEHAELAAKRRNWPGIIIGSSLLEITKDKQGNTVGREMYKYGLPATLAVFNVEEHDFGDPSAVTRIPCWIADDSHTGVWQYDDNTVYLSFDVAQKNMSLNAQEFTNSQGQKVTMPARTHEVDVKLKPGVDMNEAKKKIQEVVEKTMASARDKDAAAGIPLTLADDTPNVRTWLEDKAKFINAVEHEKVLLVILFAIISVVAVFLIFCIFYMIVVEKTRDIGIVKSVGATPLGVAGIFLGYGATIGILGGGLGLFAGYLVIHNINELHQALSRYMGVQVWDPSVYVFDKIPNTMDPTETTIIVSVAVLSSILGALVPAIRAARMNPVEAVRYE